MSIKHNTSPPKEEPQQDSQIKVFIRIRPFRNELSRRCLKLIDKGVALNFKEKIHQLYFDEVFDEDAKQERVFVQTCKPILNHVLEGCNGSVFVYGQTGTGKTYTMGTLETIKREDQGMIPLTLKYLFQELSSNRRQPDWSISLSFMQIYREEIYDLLNPRNGKLQIREDLEAGEVYVEDLTIVPISNYKQSIELINAGLDYRVTGNQKMNQLSSRSHTIVTVYITQKLSGSQYLSSNFSLIDLAGSERVKKSNSTGLRLEEAKFINTSLSALGNVIAGLAENDERFIPYRSSKLTRILKNSLSGKSRVAVICTLEISEENSNETFSTLHFANRCKEIRFANQPVINIEDFQELGQERELRDEVDRLRAKQTEYLDTIRMLESKQVDKDSERETQLGQMIESTYKVFGEINSHLRKVIVGEEKQPGGGNTVQKEKPKVTKSTTVKQIKTTITGLAQEMIDSVNTLSDLALGTKAAKTSIETETLSTIVLDLVRSNIKLYETIQVHQHKQPLQKDIAVEEYEKELKQTIVSKLKQKKLRVAQNFEEIWADNDITTNPLQSLLNSLRRGDLTINQPTLKRSDQQTPSVVPQGQPQVVESTPKDILKRMTRMESERKQKLLQESSIRMGESKVMGESRLNDIAEGEQQVSTPSRYFQRSQVNKTASKESPQASNQQPAEDKGSMQQVKRLLDSLMSSSQKPQSEERK